MIPANFITCRRFASMQYAEILKSRFLTAPRPANSQAMAAAYSDTFINYQLPRAIADAARLMWKAAGCAFSGRYDVGML